jgi:hypothetical protein
MKWLSHLGKVKQTLISAKEQLRLRCWPMPAVIPNPSLTLSKFTPAALVEQRHLGKKIRLQVRKNLYSTESVAKDNAKLLVQPSKFSLELCKSVSTSHYIHLGGSSSSMGVS